MDRDSLITAKIVINSKTKEVSIVIGKFDDEQSMVKAARELCEYLAIDFNDELLALTETIH